MSDLKSDLEILNKLEEEKNKAVDKFSDFKKSLAKYSPVKLGDEIEVNGWSNKGKTMVVNYIAIKREYLGDYYFFAKGYIKRKDGSLGVQRGEWHENRE